MEAIEKARLALREYLLANKDKVAGDLVEMRSKSEGIDILSYTERLSSSFSFENVGISIFYR